MKDQVRCWGDQHPEFLQVPPQLGPVLQVSVDENICALDQTNRVRCWGRKFALPNTDPWYLEVPDEAKFATHVTAADDYFCVNTFDDRVVCWAGRETPQVRDRTEYLGGLAGLQAYIGGACGIDQNHEVICYSEDPSYYNMKEPRQKASKIFFDEWATGCILTLENTVECFGMDNEHNQLTPKDLGKVKDLSVGRGNACVVDSNDQIRCFPIWVSNYQSVGTPFSDKVVKVAAGYTSGCAILAKDHTVKCWSK